MTTTSTRSDALRALRDLLASMFQTDLDGFRYFLRPIPGYEEARLEIPDKQGLAPAALMRAAVEWLESQQLVRAPLFEALVQRSPRREQEIRDIQRRLQRIILFATAAPEDLSPLDVEREAAGVVKALYASFADPGWAVVVRHRVTLDDLIPLVLGYRPDVLHFSGHGDLWGRIWVEGEEGGEQVPSGPLLRLVGSAAPPLQCVIWSACHSSRLAEATLKAGVPCAIGMSEAVKDGTAIQVAQGFYQGLAHGQTYASALEFGRLQAGLHRTPGTKIPVFCGDTTLGPRDLG